MVIIAKDYKANMPKSNIIEMLLLDTNQDDCDDDDGKRLSDEKIIRMLILFAFAGYEPAALMATKAIMFLEKHPEFLQKAKVCILITLICLCCSDFLKISSKITYQILQKYGVSF